MAAVIIPLEDRMRPVPAGSTRRDDPPRRADARDRSELSGRTEAVLSDSALYRRRRIVAALLVLLAGAGLARAIGDVAGWLRGDVPLPPADVRTHLIEPGDTYWSIARTLEPNGDVRPLVDRLVASNGGAPLRAGDTLELQW